MTTGRINQVTIVEASPEGHAGVSTGRGLLSPARPRVAESNRELARPAIHLPPLNSPRRESAPRGDRWSGLGISSSDGGSPSPVTLKAATGARAFPLMRQFHR